MYASVDTARQLQLPFLLICGTLFRAYGPLGRFRAHLYDYMVKFVVWTQFGLISPPRKARWSSNI